jgi:hypothetical protein
LTLLAEQTRATMADPRGIQHPQRAIALRSPLLWIERATCWTAQRPIGLVSEIGTSKSFGVRWTCPLRWSIDDGGWFRGAKDRIRRSLRRLIHLGGSKFRRAHGRGVQRMPQFKTEIPDPLRHKEPELLAPGSARTPAVGILFLVFIRKDALERSAVQIQIYYISRSERSWWQGCVELLVDHLTTGGTHRSGAVVVGCVATITRVHGPVGERCSSGKSKRVRLVPVSGWVIC